VAVDTRQTYQRHLYEVDGPIATVRFNRPEKRNAHDPLFFEELSEILDTAAADKSVRVVVIASTGPVFCAGQDLKFSAGANEEVWTNYVKINRGTRDKIQYMDKPVIARVQGPAFGGGTYIATACDLIVAVKSARFQMREIHAGNQSGGTHLLTIGKQRALEMTLLGRAIGAEEAERWGLINRCVDTEDQMDAQVQEWIDMLLQLPPLGLAATKQAANLALELAGFQLLRKADIGANLFHTEDYWEAKRAFAEKRRPNFQGK
jgi:enoyl-CoA hydratase/carnithine racemase